MPLGVLYRVLFEPGQVGAKVIVAVEEVDVVVLLPVEEVLELDDEEAVEKSELGDAIMLVLATMEADTELLPLALIRT